MSAKVIQTSALDVLAALGSKGTMAGPVTGERRPHRRATRRTLCLVFTTLVCRAATPRRRRPLPPPATAAAARNQTAAAPSPCRSLAPSLWGASRAGARPRRRSSACRERCTMQVRARRRCRRLQATVQSARVALGCRTQLPARAAAAGAAAAPPPRSRHISLPASCAAAAAAASRRRRQHPTRAPTSLRRLPPPASFAALNREQRDKALVERENALSEIKSANADKDRLSKEVEELKKGKEEAEKQAREAKEAVEKVRRPVGRRAGNGWLAGGRLVARRRLRGGLAGRAAAACACGGCGRQLQAACLVRLQGRPPPCWPPGLACRLCQPPCGRRRLPLRSLQRPVRTAVQYGAQQAGAAMPTPYPALPPPHNPPHTRQAQKELEQARAQQEQAKQASAETLKAEAAHQAALAAVRCRGRGPPA